MKRRKIKQKFDLDLKMIIWLIFLQFLIGIVLSYKYHIFTKQSLKFIPSRNDFYNSKLAHSTAKLAVRYTESEKKGRELSDNLALFIMTQLNVSDFTQGNFFLFN